MEILAPIGLFCLAQSMRLPDRAIYPVMRRVSTTIYLIHMLVWLLLSLCFGETYIYSFKFYVFTTTVCVILALLWAGIQQKRTARKRAA